MQNSSYLGIDLGSISLKLVMLDASGEVLFSKWVRVAGRPIEALGALFEECSRKHPDACISGIGVTGSGRKLIEERFPCHSVNEISAHASAITALHPDVRTVIEIGGQDSKLIMLDDALDVGIPAIRDFSMNELCAAGTGAFLDQQAARLGLSIEVFSNLALKAVTPAPIAGRCAVFAKTDMTHHQQEGRSLPDIVAGLNEALARSFMANLVRGKDLRRPIAFQGGVASNASLVMTFRRMLCPDEAIIIPAHHKVMGAIGAAIKARGEHACVTDLSLAALAKTLAHTARADTTPAECAEAHASRLQRPCGRRIDPDFKQLRSKGAFLGIDVGSVSVKLVLLGQDGILDAEYRFSDGKPVDVLRDMLAGLSSRVDPASIQGVGVTGSGRHFVGSLIGADAIRNEISAQAMAAALICPQADTVFEIGGQDAKFMRVREGTAQSFAMNRVCAAGTGAFLQEQAARLEVELDHEFAETAFRSERPAELGTRCTVFMESDLVSHQQMGFARGDLIAGLARSVVANYMEKVVAGAKVGRCAVFLGGVAENEAIVSALEEVAGMPILTSSAGKLSGAIGAAMAAMEKVRASGKPSIFRATDTKLEFDAHICGDCSMSCRISSTKDEPRRHFGSRCGKWDCVARSKSRSSDAPLNMRRDAITKAARGRVGGAGRPTIGIPLALMAYDLLPAWTAFFEELDCTILVSPPTTDEILAEGVRHLVVETCLPVKAYCSHVKWLDARNVDFIFVPSLVIVGRDAHGKETVHCPYIQSLVQFARPITKKELLNPVINWKLDPNSAEREMASLAERLGKTSAEGRRAWRTALKAQAVFKNKLRDAGERTLQALGNGTLNRAFLLMGKDYNALDERLSAGIASTLEARGETVLTQDMIATDAGDYSAAYRTMYWTHGKEMLAAAERMRALPTLHPVLITSFGCGPDSFTIKFARDILGDKPLLVLEVDEHSSPVGMETRIEAFLDSLGTHEGKMPAANRQGFAPQPGVKKVLLPQFSDHGYAFAAAVKALGFTPILTGLPDDESARLGAKFSGHGECHPYVIMLGDFLKAASSRDDLSDACYFMPESGACRVGQFGTQMRLAAEEMGVHLPVYTRIEDLATTTGGTPRRTYLKALTTYWEMMRGMDFFMQRHLEVRAHEQEPGSADAAKRDGHAALLKCILEDRPLDGLKRASAILDGVPTDRAQSKVRIGITGDYYTRVCDYANGSFFRDIERMGGVVMLPPTMSDFVKYDSRQRMGAAARHHNAGDLALGAALRIMVDTREWRARKVAGSDLDYDIPLDYNRAEKLLEPYMDMRLPAGLTGSVAAILEQIRAGADGIVSAITFHCNYGLAIGSVMSQIGRDHPQVPMLTLIFEGLKPTHNRLRLEAFMERVKEQAWKRRDV
jgi:predicted CoA-substrate-specific enzyme activase